VRNWQARDIAEKLGDRDLEVLHFTSFNGTKVQILTQKPQALACTSLGATLAAHGDMEAAARAAVRALAVLQSIERDVGEHDDRRVAVFEAQLTTYTLLQSVLLQQGHAEWALGVAVQAKARALSHFLNTGAGSRVEEQQAAVGQGSSPAGAGHCTYEATCSSWWAAAQELARKERVGTRILEYSFLLGDCYSDRSAPRLAIWVLSAEGELLCSKIVPCTLVPCSLPPSGIVGSEAPSSDSSEHTLQHAATAPATSCNSSSVLVGSALGMSDEELIAILAGCAAPTGMLAPPPPPPPLSSNMTYEDSLEELLKQVRETMTFPREGGGEWEVREGAGTGDKEREASSERSERSEGGKMCATCGEKISQCVCPEGSPGVPDAESAELPKELQSDADASSAQRAPAKDAQGRKLETKTLLSSHASRKRAAEMAIKAAAEAAEAAAEAAQASLLRKLYHALISPVETHLLDAEEVLIVPQKWLFEVPWAALMDANGRYLVERHVLRVAPSLRVARQASDALFHRERERKRERETNVWGHMVVVGNPLPIPAEFCTCTQRLSEQCFEAGKCTRGLPFAEEEAVKVADILNKKNKQTSSVLGSHTPQAYTKTHVFKTETATKANVEAALQGADWAHFACHADLETDSLVLAIPSSGTDAETLRVWEEKWKMQKRGTRTCLKRRKLFFTEDKRILNDDAIVNMIDDVARTSLKMQTNLSMGEVQGAGGSPHTLIPLPPTYTHTSGGDGGAGGSEKVAGLKLGKGSTIVLSACNTGLGEIKAEGVVGLSRSFLSAGAAAVIVSLWSVDDGSTGALMDHLYTHLVDDWTVPQALRLAMLRLARRAPLEHATAATRMNLDGHDSGGLREEWKNPKYWAGFLVVGATTRLSGSSTSLSCHRSRLPKSVV
jgi:CHAT domain-containing protein